MARFDLDNDPLKSDASLAQLDYSDKDILAALVEKSFSSVRQSARAITL
jgi:hypothetical protein